MIKVDLALAKFNQSDKEMAAVERYEVQKCRLLFMDIESQEEKDPEDVIRLEEMEDALQKIQESNWVIKDQNEVMRTPFDRQKEVILRLRLMLKTKSAQGVVLDLFGRGREIDFESLHVKMFGS